MKSYDTFQGVKRIASAHLSEVAQEIPRLAGGRKLPLLRVLLLGSTCCGFVFFNDRQTTTSKDVGAHRIDVKPSVTLPILASSARYDVSNNAQFQIAKTARPCSTEADVYYQEFKKLPKPPIMHDNLTRLLDRESRANDSLTERTDRILIIGDVHGCLDELKLLVEKASNEYNDGKQFSCIVLVGDLCNKGPYSSEVIQYVRMQPHWYSIRGNHDNAALEAALGDPDRIAKERYAWVKKLSDEDVDWMSKLPYTIRIPKDMVSSDNDVLVVHAGFVPFVEMDEQLIETMLTVRNLTLMQTSNAQIQYEYYNSSQTNNSPIPVAKAWSGPELVLFGHDAKRGIQVEDHAIGLDSGCVYGNKLTGIVFPEKKLVSVDAARVYCPINSSKICG